VVVVTVRRMDVIGELRMTEVKTPPTYREIENKLIELEKEHKILGERYDSLVKLIRKQGKDKVDDHDAYLRNYAREWK
jgi:hypothetical protein